MKKVSIVVPVYNEEDNICHFYEEISSVIETLPYQFEIIFIDDGSSDTSRQILTQLEEKDKKVQAIFLARNFGHQLALTCGLDYADGDAVITMDGDMQHPPQMIPILLDKWKEGFEIVQTIRKTTEGVSLFKRLTSKYYYYFLNLISNVHIEPGGSDFRLIDKKVVTSFRLFREHARFIRGIIGEMGYKKINIEFVAPPRFSGVSKFSLRKMLHFAIDGILSYSRLPLRFGLYSGVVCGIISFLLLLHVLFIKLATDDAVPGWATISASILFFGGIQLMILGIIGEYIGRIFEEVKERPLYLIARAMPRNKKQEQAISRRD